MLAGVGLSQHPQQSHKNADQRTLLAVPLRSPQQLRRCPSAPLGTALPTPRMRKLRSDAAFAKTGYIGGNAPERETGRNFGGDTVTDTDTGWETSVEVPSRALTLALIKAVYGTRKRHGKRSRCHHDSAQWRNSSRCVPCSSSRSAAERSSAIVPEGQIHRAVWYTKDGEVTGYGDPMTTYRTRLQNNVYEYISAAK